MRTFFALGLAFALGLIAGSARGDEVQWGGPEASAPIASAGDWVPVQAATKTLLGQASPIRAQNGSFSNVYIPTNGKLCLDGSACNTRVFYNGSQVSYYVGGIQQMISVIGTNYLLNDTSVDTRIYNQFSGAVFISDADGTCIGDGTSTECDGATTSGTLSLINYGGTAGSGTGITTNNTGAIRTFVHKITVAETALTAAATTQDITIWTVPAKTRLNRIVVSDVTGFTGGGLTNMQVQCGSAAGGNQYLLIGSIFATGAVLGDVAAEIGAGLLSATVADIPSMTATTAISCRFTSTTANVVAATAGTATFYIEGVTYP